MTWFCNKFFQRKNFTLYRKLEISFVVLNEISFFVPLFENTQYLDFWSGNLINQRYCCARTNWWVGGSALKKFNLEKWAVWTARFCSDNLHKSSEMIAEVIRTQKYSSDCSSLEIEFFQSGSPPSPICPSTTVCLWSTFLHRTNPFTWGHLLRSWHKPMPNPPL